MRHFLTITKNTPSYSEEDFGLIDEPSFPKGNSHRQWNKTLKSQLPFNDSADQTWFQIQHINKAKTKFNFPCEPFSNNNKDNAESNLVVYVDDEINGYVVTDIIGQGVSSLVFEVKSNKDGNFYALKVIKNKRAYKNQSLIE